MKKAIGMAAIVGALAFSTAAFADQPTPPPGNSEPGLARYLANPGRQQVTEVGAQCGSGAGSGAFGFFGKGNNLAGGANGQATGDANSSICGNKDGTKDTGRELNRSAIKSANRTVRRTGISERRAAEA